MRLLLTAGGTREPVDAVRYLGNRSSGKLAAALAEVALSRGHDLTLLLGQASATFPQEAAVERVETTADLHEAVLRHLPHHDALVMAAAVADYRPVAPSPGKLHREDGPMTLQLEPTQDILAAAASARTGQTLVGFSLDEDTDAARQRAKAKLQRKGCDLLVYNPIQTLAADAISPTLFWPSGREHVVREVDKREFASILIDAVEQLVASRR